MLDTERHRDPSILKSLATQPAATSVTSVSRQANGVMGIQYERMVQLYRWFPSVLKAITIVRPETLVRWHRSGFRRYWRWKSGSGPV